MGQKKRRADALAPSLGAGHDGAADCDSPVGDRFIDAKKMAAVGRLWLERFWDSLGPIGPGTPLKPERHLKGPNPILPLPYEHISSLAAPYAQSTASYHRRADHTCIVRCAASFDECFASAIGVLRYRYRHFSGVAGECHVTCHTVQNAAARKAAG